MSWLSWGVILFGGLILYLDSSPAAQSSTSESKLKAAKIASWKWDKDPDFGGSGSIVWRVEVENVSTKYIKRARVELSTYDSSHEIVTSDRTWVTAIPPGEARTAKGYADYYGTEEHAVVHIIDVDFAGE